MTRVRVENFTISLERIRSGAGQGVENPLGVGGEACTTGSFPLAPGGRCMDGRVVREGSMTSSLRGAPGNGGLDPGRNMFETGPWPLAGHELEGLGGNNPPYHVPVFVLTHHATSAHPDGRRHDIPFRHRRHSRGA